MLCSVLYWVIATIRGKLQAVFIKNPYNHFDRKFIGAFNTHTMKDRLELLKTSRPCFHIITAFKKKRRLPWICNCEYQPGASINFPLSFLMNVLPLCICPQKICRRITGGLVVIGSVISLVCTIVCKKFQILQNEFAYDFCGWSRVMH